LHLDAVFLKYFYSQICQRDAGGDVFEVFLFAGMREKSKKSILIQGANLRIVVPIITGSKIILASVTLEAMFLKYSCSQVCREILEIDLDTRSILSDSCT